MTEKPFLKMSSNIYEDPNLMMNVRYKGVKEHRGEREERLVDIYESADNQVGLPRQVGVHSSSVAAVTAASGRGHCLTPATGAHTQKHLPAVQRNPFRVAALVLGPLCLLLVAGVIVLSKIYISIIWENEQLRNNYQELQTSYNNLSSSYCQSQGTENQNITEWKRFRCSCYYKSTEIKNWTDSRTDCQKRGADLVMINNKEENDFVSKLAEHGASWIGLQSVKTKSWEQNWKWADESTLKYTVWKVGVNMNAAEGNTAYINQEGKWIPTNNGSKQWICEKQIY